MNAVHTAQSLQHEGIEASSEDPTTVVVELCDCLEALARQVVAELAAMDACFRKTVGLVLEWTDSSVDATMAHDEQGFREEAPQ